MGTLTMTAFTLGMPQEPVTAADGVGAQLPEGTAAEQTNI